MNQTTCEISINGEYRQVAAGLDVASLLRQLNLKTNQLAVEVNRTLVRRSDHAQTTLNDGDRVEIVTLAGGG